MSKKKPTSAKPVKARRSKRKPAKAKKPASPAGKKSSHFISGVEFLHKVKELSLRYKVPTLCAVVEPHPDGEGTQVNWGRFGLAPTSVGPLIMELVKDFAAEKHDGVSIHVEEINMSGTSDAQTTGADHQPAGGVSTKHHKETTSAPSISEGSQDGIEDACQ